MYTLMHDLNLLHDLFILLGVGGGGSTGVWVKVLCIGYDEQ